MYKIIQVIKIGINVKNVWNAQYDKNVKMFKVKD